MGARRGHGEGSIGQRSDGRWTARVDLGVVNGKRKRKQIYGRTRKEVAEALKALLRDHQQGVPLLNDRFTVAQFLAQWLEETVKVRRRPKTYASYAAVVRLHVVPSIGTVPLAKLTPQQVQTLLHHKRASGLSARSVQYIQGIVRSALTQALKWGLVTRNVAALVDAPPVERFVTHPLTPAQAQALLRAAQGQRLEGICSIAVWLGLRQGEILGLRWQDVDLDARTLRVDVALQVVDGTRQLVPPKTTRSRRVLPLPRALVPILEAQRTRQANDRLLADDAWQEHGLVFTTRTGRPILPRNLVREFKALLERAGLPPIRFHDLRHSCASMLAANGVPARVAMDVLGHANITTTQNIYTHVFDDAKRQAAEVMDRVFGGQPNDE